ncbi:MAG: response regulator, partial [Deltaproteobacteria bacterium]|nr:response regulator [Deltaproteobacteria bacterium]
LERLGYSVITAATPKEAIELVEENSSKIDLFITDVIMPEMNGRELADCIREIRPGIKSLFMSGYTADVIVQQGVLEKEVNFIQKPFLMEGLSKKIREILD